MAADIDRLIDSVYAAGADPSGWADVLAAVAGRLRGAYGALHVGDTDGSGFNFGATYGLPAEAIAAYAGYYFQLNPVTVPLSKQDEGAVIADHMLVPRKEYQASEFYNDYARPFDIEGTATAVLEKTGGQMACFSVVQVNGAEPYSRNELALLRKLLPHLQRAVDLNRKFAAVQARSDLAENVLDALDLAILFLGEHGRIVRANPAAEDLIRTNAGALSVQQGRVVATDRQSDAMLAALVEDAIHRRGGFGGTFAIKRPEPFRPLIAKVMPYLKESAPEAPSVRALFFLRDPDAHPSDSLLEVASAFRLTPSEAHLVTKLMELADLGDAASMLGIRETTARTHLARAMDKTSTRKQSELVRVILASRAPLR
jgi:DNA-binding CsgD family transcriptional regulator/PAS domain-containing protein